MVDVTPKGLGFRVYASQLRVQGPVDESYLRAFRV